MATPKRSRIVPRRLMEDYVLARDLGARAVAFVEHYNQRDHESPNNVPVAGAHFGKAETVINQREMWANRACSASGPRSDSASDFGPGLPLAECVRIGNSPRSGPPERCVFWLLQTIGEKTPEGNISANIGAVPIRSAAPIFRPTAKIPMSGGSKARFHLRCRDGAQISRLSKPAACLAATQPNVIEGPTLAPAPG